MTIKLLLLFIYLYFSFISFSIATPESYESPTLSPALVPASASTLAPAPAQASPLAPAPALAPAPELAPAPAPEVPQDGPWGGSDIAYWCQTTPHPDQCNYFLSQNNQTSPQNQTHFRQLLVQVALDRAIYSQARADKLEKECRSKRKKSAWSDCSKLFNDTISQLNRILEGIRTKSTIYNCSDFDAQTWLSTALTNLETCRYGSVDLNVTKFISPIVSTNVSECISNSLAINNALLSESDDNNNNNNNEDFPDWVSKGDRRLLQTSSLASRANVVVAKDRSGRFSSVQAAINYAAKVKRGTGRFIIYVKRGVYNENIEVGYDLNNIMLVGDGLRYTVITGGRSVARGWTTYSSATAGIDGTGFIARGITFRNTAGPQNGQAVALRSASDLSVFYACGFEGYQDTLFVQAQRQFFKICYIYGTIDFIFGNAAVVFQNCNILVRRPLHGQVNVITAQGRTDPFQNTGISIHYSRIMGAPDLKPVAETARTYLGRPWQEYSRTVLLKTYIDSLVSPQGWLAWQNSNFAWNTLYYGEYGNIGPGAVTKNRVKWRGFHVIRSASEASKFTVGNLIAGTTWLRGTGVPFYAGL